MLNLFFILMLATIGLVLHTMITMLRREQASEEYMKRGADVKHLMSISVSNENEDVETIYSNTLLRKPMVNSSVDPLFHNVGISRYGNNTIPLRRPLDLYQPKEHLEKRPSDRPHTA